MQHEKLELLASQKAKHKEDEKDAKEREEEKQRRLAEEMATMLAIRQQSEIEARARALRIRQEREVLQEMIRKDNLQEKYVVRENEDLTMIAVRKFKDARVADLIYEINKRSVEVRWTGGRRSYYVKPGTVLILPSPRQVREWLARTGGIAPMQNKQGASSGMAGRSNSAQEDRRANIEKVIGKIRESSDGLDGRVYSVRLGDTLRSIAMKHPDLRDVTLWRLLAEKNGLSTDTDSKGAPLAVLIRGAVLNIPTAEEISAYRAETAPAKPVVFEPQHMPSHAILEMATKPCGGCDRLLSHTASLCPACGYVFESVPGKPTVEEQATTFALPQGIPTLPLDQSEGEQQQTVVTSPNLDTTVVDSDKTTLSLPEAAGTVKTPVISRGGDSHLLEVEGTRVIEAFSQTCRLVKVDVEVNGRRIVKQQLEVLSGEDWIPVLAYEVGNHSSTRHEYSRDGRRKSISIDLPSVAVGQMVQNELSQNWEKYCERFLSGRKLSV